MKVPDFTPIKINVEHVQQAIDALKRAKREDKFEMYKWLEPVKCGFAGCLLGTCFLDKQVNYNALGYEGQLSHFNSYVENDISNIMRDFATFLGVSNVLANYLCSTPDFYGVTSLWDVTADMVIEKLEELIKE